MWDMMYLETVKWFCEFQQESDIKEKLSGYIVYGVWETCFRCMHGARVYKVYLFLSCNKNLESYFQSVYSSPPLDNREWVHASRVLGKRSPTELHLQSLEACIFNEHNKVSIHSRTKENTYVFFYH